LAEHGADLKVASKPASRGRTAYLGKANDPRKSSRALVAAAAGATPEEIAALSSKDVRQFAPPPADAPAAAPAARQSAAGQPAAGRDAEPLLSAWRVSPRSRSKPQHRE